jgi:hypothetical protein
MRSRVARWFIFRPKIGIFVDFGESCNVGYCCILRTFEICYGPLVYNNILWQFGIFPRFGILNREKSGNPGAKKAHRKKVSTGFARPPDAG